VRADPDDPSGWETLERLTPWHGLPTVGGRDLHEDPDGTVWVTTSRGLVRIPAEVRRTSPAPPRVALVEARVDDRRMELAGAPELPHHRNRLELRFAALSYRAPTAVRYQVRLGPGQGWSDARSQPVVRWVDLPAGEYRAQVRASLDGRTWSAPSTTFRFSVLPPWYLRPASLVLLALAVAMVLYLAYRARVQHLLELERQRTRIAMDLHDEIGSALGSVGIQAGMLERPGVDEKERRYLASEIGTTAAELGTVLTDIVWSLDPRTSTLGDLAHRLEERGRHLFSALGTGFRVELPAGRDALELPAPVQRNVLLVGLEALRNAATHSGAGSVILELERAGGRRWRLTVRDDGCGFDPPSAGGEGMGLRSMRRRAREMGGDITWRRPDGGGTEVVLEFPVAGPSSTLLRLRRWLSRAWDRMNVLLRRR
jgi:signal transduction histidine kinase